MLSFMQLASPLTLEKESIAAIDLVRLIEELKTRDLSAKGKFVLSAGDIGVVQGERLRRIVRLASGL